MQIIIPFATIEERSRYHNALLHVLAQIEVDNANEDLQKDLQAVYDLLRHLLPDTSSNKAYGVSN